MVCRIFRGGLLITAFVFAAGIVFFGGCEEDSIVAGHDYYEYDVEPEKLKVVKPLEIEDYRSEADVNEAGDIDESYIRKADDSNTIRLTIEQCRQRALENNLDLKAQLISPAIAEQRVNEEQAKFEWTFEGSTRVNLDDTPTSTTLSGSETRSVTTNVGVDIPLRTGGTVSVSAFDNRTRTNNTFATLNPAYTSDLAFSFSQPLLRNAGRRVNMHSIRVAEYSRQITDAQTKLEVIKVIAAADRVYWRLYSAQKELEVRLAEHELAKAQLARAKRFVDAGTRSQIEVIRAEAGAAQKLEQIILAENNVRDRERELKRLLNMPGVDLQSEIVLMPATEPDPIYYDLNESEMVSRALANRMELLELEFQIASDVSNIDYLRNQALPLAIVDYTYNVNGLGPSRKDSLDLLYDWRFEDHSFGVSVVVPLGNQAAKSRLRQAVFQKQQRLATKRSRRQLVELEVLNALDQLEANWQRILAGRQRSILDGRLYEAEKRRFNLGLGTSTDVLEAQTNYADAQSAEILALAEYQIAMVDLAYATGTVLGSAKVYWQEWEAGVDGGQ